MKIELQETKSIFGIEMPDLTDESVVIIHNWLYNVLDSFEVYYFNQIHQHAMEEQNEKIPDSFAWRQS